MGRNRKHVPDHIKQKHPKNKKTKTTLIFDEEARREYLTGFQKRKKERRKRAQHETIERLKEEKRLLKIQKRRELYERVRDSPAVIEVEHLVKPSVVDLPNHTITISDISGTDISEKSGVMLGMNQHVPADEDVDQDDHEDEDNADNDEEDDQIQHSGGKGENDSDENVEKTGLDGVTHKKKRAFKPKWKRHRNFSHLMDKKFRPHKKRDFNQQRGITRSARKYSNKRKA